MTFEGYESLGFSIEFPDRRLVIQHAPSGWRLTLAKSYPPQEQMADFKFSKEDPNAPDILVGTRWMTLQPLAARKREITIDRLEGISDDAWAASDLEVLVRMVLMEQFPDAWFLGKPVPPHEFIVAPKSWPRDAHFTPVHSLGSFIALS